MCIYIVQVYLPDWLRERAESQLVGLVHPDSADGLMKASENTCEEPTSGLLSMQPQFVQYMFVTDIHFMMKHDERKSTIY